MIVTLPADMLKIPGLEDWSCNEFPWVTIIEYISIQRDRVKATKHVSLSYKGYVSAGKSGLNPTFLLWLRSVFSWQCEQHKLHGIRIWETLICSPESDTDPIFLQCGLIVKSHIGICVSFTSLITFLHSWESRAKCKHWILEEIGFCEVVHSTIPPLLAKTPHPHTPPYRSSSHRSTKSHS